MSQSFLVVVKADCPTCQLVLPVLETLAGRGDVTLLTQDDPAFPAVPGVEYDGSLERSFDLGIEIVPALLAFDGGIETGRCEGWERRAWQGLVGDSALGQTCRLCGPGALPFP